MTKIHRKLLMVYASLPVMIIEVMRTKNNFHIRTYSTPTCSSSIALQWRQNERDSVSNHQPHDCLLNRFFSDADQRKHQSSASLAFVWGIHRGSVNSPHKWPVTRKMFPFDDVIMVDISPYVNFDINSVRLLWGYIYPHSPSFQRWSTASI